MVNYGRGLQWTERANGFRIKFCEYGGCSILIVEKCCRNMLKTIVPVSIFVKVRSTAFIALNSLFDYSTWHDIVVNIYCTRAATFVDQQMMNHVSPALQP